MPSDVKSSLSAQHGGDLPLNEPPDSQHLEQIKAYLDLSLIALESLTINSDGIVQAVHALNLEETIAERVSLWRLRQPTPLRKKIDVEEARSLVLVIAYLAQQHQELLRRAVALLEQMLAQNQELQQVTLLGDYLNNFSKIYRERLEPEGKMSEERMTQIAFKLLVDLLFYSSPNGHRRLWLALLDSSD